MRYQLVLVFVIGLFFQGKATQLLVPMDDSQSDHLKAYGISFWALENTVVIEWLLNYRGGSFLMPHLKTIEEELILRNVKYEVLAEGQVNQIKNQISNPEVNMEIVQLEKAPKIAVYTPEGKQPWDDAVTLVLEYAEIPYDKIYDSAIIMGVLPKYDWLHLHHEDFTGQYGKFYAAYRSYPWYQEQVADAEAVLLANGEVVLGNNQENIAYPSGLCAERVALFYTGANYPIETIKLLVIVAKGDLLPFDKILSPCGSCRQVLVESESRQTEPFQVILVSQNRRTIRFSSAKDLLPFAFGTI